MSSKLEPAIWSRDTGQQIPCFDRCQLIIVWMSNINEVRAKPRLCLFGTMAAMLSNSVVVVVHTRPRAIPLAMITMRKSTHRFPLLSRDKYGAPLGGPLGRWSSAIISGFQNWKYHDKTIFSSNTIFTACDFSGCLDVVFFYFSFVLTW